MTDTTTQLKILIIVTVWPEPESSAAGWRVLNVIDTCKSAGWNVTVASPSVLNDHSARLRQSGLQIYSSPLNDSSFDSWIAEQAFDVAFLDRFIIEEQFGWKIAEFSPNTLRVLDTEDLHFVRRARQIELQKNPLKNLSQVFENQINFRTEDSIREIAAIYRCDLTLLLSDFEHRLLLDQFWVPAELLRIFRFCYKTFPETPSYESRSHFVAIGNFRHPPNADATLWLKHEIWPKIRGQLPTQELHIYGAYPSRDMMDLNSPKDGFLIKGPAIDVHETLQKYRVNLAPLRFGAGIKGKISDGWRAGTPVVTTPIGAEGMGYEDLAVRTAEEFAKQAIQLYREPDDWSASRARGHEVLRRFFDFETNSKNLVAELKSALAEKELRRHRNFVGQMLAYHTMRSTKYFSRWIELKESALKNNDPLKSK